MKRSGVQWLRVAESLQAFASARDSAAITVFVILNTIGHGLLPKGAAFRF